MVTSELRRLADSNRVAKDRFCNSGMWWVRSFTRPQRPTNRIEMQRSIRRVLPQWVLSVLVSTKSPATPTTSQIVLSDVPGDKLAHVSQIVRPFWPAIRAAAHELRQSSAENPVNSSILVTGVFSRTGAFTVQPNSSIGIG